VTQQVAEAKSATLQQAIALRTREGEQQQRYQLAELAAKLDARAPAAGCWPSRSGSGRSTGPSSAGARRPRRSI
ncbi:hypothetical protein, partial [Nannocystis exedens]|uniref:hypothetical protein n=1 Tax=Nannocystis exedens TaxID=54 RepID=UPI001475A512